MLMKLQFFLLFLFAPTICLGAPAISSDRIVNNKELAIHFIDVGHGDATLVNCPNGNNLLIDAGSSSGFPGGKLRYYLLKQGGIAGKVLEALIVTHPEIDKYNLISRALDKVSVKNAYLAGSADDYSDVKFNHWLNMIERNRKSFLSSAYFDAEVAPNTEISCGDANIHILVAPVGSDGAAKNALSIALMIRYGDFEAILAGGATTATEDVIMGRFSKEWLNSDVLKISNHGSLKTSTSVLWTKTIKPKVAVVSAGLKNRYGLPRKEVIKRLEPYTSNIQNTHSLEYATWDSTQNKYSWHSTGQYTKAIYSTATNGNVVVKSDGIGYKIYFDK